MCKVLKVSTSMIYYKPKEKEYDDTLLTKRIKEIF